MNVLKQINVILFSVLLCITTIYGFNVCNVDLNEPWFEVKSSLNESILIIDNDGDAYFKGTDHSSKNKKKFESFEVGNTHFNVNTSKFSKFTQDLTFLPSTGDSLIIQSVLGINVTQISKTGDIETVGKGAYEDSQAGCTDDGLYCNADGLTIENRDYYCKITGDKSGVCNYKVLSSENCAKKDSDDTDGGDNVFVRGTLSDYTNCSLGSCNYVNYTDTCSSPLILNEYYPFKFSFATYSIDCSDKNFFFCSGLNRYKKMYECDIGACKAIKDLFVETCSAPSPIYSNWTCVSETKRKRVVISYLASCNAVLGCDVSDFKTNEIENAPVDFKCSEGEWIPMPKVISITAIPNPWSVELSESSFPVAKVTVCMESEYADSCSWCDISIPCNGCKIYDSNGATEWQVCKAIATNSSTGISDSKYGKTTCICSDIMESTCTYGGWGGSCNGNQNCCVGSSLDSCCINTKGDSCGANLCTNPGTIQCDGSCTGTSYKPSGTSCGVLKECDGSGNCINT